MAKSRFSVYRKPKGPGAYIQEHLDDINDLRNLVIGTSGLLVLDNVTDAYMVSENIEYWAKESMYGQPKVIEFAQLILG